MQLHFKKAGDGFPLIVLHGLMGSLDNWQSFAKSLSSGFSVYSIDQRNHGRSPWSDDFNYEIMAGDLNDFFEQHAIGKAHVLGHSMGGKAAMQFALTFPEKVERLIVVDVAPVGYDDRHSKVFEALLAVDLNTLSRRSDAELTLRKFLEEEDTIQFLMKGLYRNDNDHFAWRFNVKVLQAAYTAISAEIQLQRPFQGEVLFVRGGNSDYVGPAAEAKIKSLFPNYRMETIAGSGHWVHAEKPVEFLNAVRKFLISSPPSAS